MAHIYIIDVTPKSRSLSVRKAEIYQTCFNIFSFWPNIMIFLEGHTQILQGLMLTTSHFEAATTDLAEAMEFSCD